MADGASSSPTTPLPSSMSADRWDGFDLGYVPPDHLKISPDLKLHTETAEEIDPITFEVIRNALWILNEEHADTIRKIGASPVVSAANDLNTAIQTEIGEAIMFAPYIQYFTGFADVAVKWTLENRSANPGIEEGDIFFQNDPMIGISHQMDIQTFAPVFIDGAVFCWVFNSAHVRDIGGTEPGSFCVGAKDIYGEATPIPPIKLVERGRLRTDIEQMIRRHSRIPELLALDLRSQLAGIHAATTRAKELVARYGAPTVKAAMRKIINDASAAVSERLKRLPDGVWRDVTYLGAFTTGDRNAHRIALSMTKTGDQLTFSNEGTDPQVGSANCGFGGWRAAIASSMSALLAWDQRYCTGGVLRHARFRPVPRTITSADRSAAVSNVLGISSTGAMSANVISKMLSVDPELGRNQMAIRATTTWTGLSGVDQWGRPYATVSLDELASGSGAFSFRDGIDQGGTFSAPDTEAGDCETWEQASPILYLFRHTALGSGHGRYRGGRGVVVGWVGHGTDRQFMSAASIPLSLPGANGMWGGHAGPGGFFQSAHDCGIASAMANGALPGSVRQLAEAVELKTVPPKSAGVRLLSDDVWIMDTGGTGGFGDPLKREPEKVLEDMSAGMPRDQAERIYGVVAADGRVDAVKTAERRAEIRTARRARARPAPRPLGQGPATGDERLIFPIGDSLKVVERGGTALIACADCGHGLCDATGNYKLGCDCIDGSLTDLDPVFFGNPEEEIEDPMVYRSYICPGCSVIIENELARATEPPFWDVRLAPLRSG